MQRVPVPGDLPKRSQVRRAAARVDHVEKGPGRIGRGSKKEKKQKRLRGTLATREKETQGPFQVQDWDGVAEGPKLKVGGITDSRKGRET